MKHGVSLQLEPEMCVRSAHGLCVLPVQGVRPVWGEEVKGGQRMNSQTGTRCHSFCCRRCCCCWVRVRNNHHGVKLLLAVYREWNNVLLLPRRMCSEVPPRPGWEEDCAATTTTKNNAKCFLALAERSSMIFHRVRWRCECFMAIRPVLIP